MLVSEIQFIFHLIELNGAVGCAVCASTTLCEVPPCQCPDLWASRQEHRTGVFTQHQNLTSTYFDIIVKMRSWGTPTVFAGLLVLCVVVSAIELPTGPNVPTNAAITLTGASLEGVAEATDAATPSRVLPTPAIMSTRVSVRLSSKQAVPQDVPAGVVGHAEALLSWGLR